MSKGTFLGDIIDGVLSVFGVGGHNETYSDIQISTLLTKGIAAKRHKKAAILSADGDIWQYARIYKMNQREYRRKFSAATVSRLGYAPTTNATVYLLDTALVLAYLQANVVPPATEVTKLNEGAASIDVAAFYGLQSEPMWSNFSSTLTEGGNKYRYLSATKTSATDLTADLRRHHDETIIENLTTNYNYDAIGNTVVLNTGPTTANLTGTSGTDTEHIRIEVGTSETIEFDILPSTGWDVNTMNLPDGVYTVEVYETDSLLVETLTGTYDITIDSTELYDVGTISSNLYGIPVQYKTIVTRQLDGTTEVELFTDVEDITKVVPSDVYDTETMQVEYLIDQSGEYYLYLEDLDTVPNSVRTSTPIALTPIITVKEENEVLNKDDPNLRKMMKNVGVDPESIFPSLDQADLNSAYLIYGIPFDTTDTSCISMLFDMFTLNTTSAGNIQINITNLDMNYSYGYVKTETIGSIGPKGTVSKVIVNEPTSVTDGGTTTTTNHWQMYLKKQVTEEEYITMKVTDLVLTYKVSGETNTMYANAAGDEARYLIPLDLLHATSITDYYNIYEESLALLSYAEKTIYVQWYETAFFQFVMVAIQIVMVAFAIATGQGWLVAVAMGLNYAAEWVIEEFGITGGWATAIRVMAVIAILFFAPVNMYTVVGTSMNAMSTYFKSQTTEAQKDYEQKMKDIKDSNDDVVDQLKDLQEEQDRQGLLLIAKYHADLESSRAPLVNTNSPEYFHARMSPDFVFEEITRSQELDWDAQNQIRT